MNAYRHQHRTESSCADPDEPALPGKMAVALRDPRKRTIMRFARDHGGEWTVGELHAAHSEFGSVRELHTLCMRLVVAELLTYVPTDATRLREQPFRLRFDPLRQ